MRCNSYNFPKLSSSFSGYFEVTDDGKNLMIFPDKGGDFMVYFASLEKQLSTGGIRSKLQIIPIVDQLKYTYLVSLRRCNCNLLNLQAVYLEFFFLILTIFFLNFSMLPRKEVLCTYKQMMELRTTALSELI